MYMDLYGPTALAGRALRAHRTPHATGTENDCPAGGDRAGQPIRASGRAGSLVDGEVVQGESTGHRGPQRFRFDHRFVAGVAQFLPGLTRSISGIGQHLGRFGLIGQQTGTDLRVTGMLTAGLGQLAVGDDPVSGSIAICAKNPSCRRCTVLWA